MAQLQVKNPSIIDTMLELTDSGKISAISGHELVGNSEQQNAGYWRPTVDDGELSWSWDIQSTAIVPSTADITGPQGKQGEQGLPGADGASGTSVNLKSVNEVTGGTEVTLSWGQNNTSAFIVPSGISGKDGSNGISPTIELEPIVTGASGTKVSITDVNGTSSFNVMNGVDGSFSDIATSGYVTGDGTTTNSLTLTVAADEAIEAVSSKLTSKENTSHADWTLKDVYVCTESELASLAQASTNGSIFFVVSASN